MHDLAQLLVAVASLSGIGLGLVWIGGLKRDVAALMTVVRRLCERSDINGDTAIGVGALTSHPKPPPAPFMRYAPARREDK